MGTFHVVIGVGSERGRYESVDVLVDTGATYTVLPRALLERLGVVPHAGAPLVIADGSRIELEIGRAWRSRSCLRPTGSGGASCRSRGC